VENWLGEKVENRRYYEDLQRGFLRQHWVMREGLVYRKGERRFRQVARKRMMFRRAVAFAACVSVFILTGIGDYWGSGKRGEGEMGGKGGFSRNDFRSFPNSTMSPVERNKRALEEP